MIHVVEVSVSVGMVTWRLAGICVLLDCYVDWRKVLNLFACQCHRSRSVWRVQGQSVTEVTSYFVAGFRHRWLPVITVSYLRVVKENRTVQIGDSSHYPT